MDFIKPIAMASLTMSELKLPTDISMIVILTHQLNGLL